MQCTQIGNALGESFRGGPYGDLPILFATLFEALLRHPHYMGKLT